MSEKSNDLIVLNDLIAISDQPLREEDFIECQKALLGKSAAVAYTVVVVCCAAMICLAWLSAWLGMELNFVNILLLTAICFPVAAMCYFAIPEWLGKLRYRQYCTVHNKQPVVIFYRDHFEIHLNHVRISSYPYYLVRRIIKSENLLIILLPNYILFPARCSTIADDVLASILQQVELAQGNFR